MKKLTSIKDLKLMSNTIRQDIIKMLVKAGSGHSAGPLGMADVFTALYFNILNQNPKNPLSDKRDRLILSNGHICPVRYAAMARAGYFPVKELLTLRKYRSRLQGHPSSRNLPPMEAATGSLGQGVFSATVSESVSALSSITALLDAVGSFADSASGTATPNSSVVFNGAVAELAMSEGYRYSDRLQVPLFKNAWGT